MRESKRTKSKTTPRLRLPPFVPALALLALFVFGCALPRKEKPIDQYSQESQESNGEGTESDPSVASGSPTGSDPTTAGSTSRTVVEPNVAAGWIMEVGNLLHTYWTRPGSISDATCSKLVAEVRVKLSSSLAIEKYELKRSSGDAIFDNSLGPAFTKMIADGARFPTPPPGAGISIEQLTGGRLVIQFICEAPK